MSNYNAKELRSFIVDKITFKQFVKLQDLERKNGYMPHNMEQVSKSNKVNDMYLRFLIKLEQERKEGIKEDREDLLKLIDGGNRWGQPTYEAKGKLKLVG